MVIGLLKFDMPLCDGVYECCGHVWPPNRGLGRRTIGPRYTPSFSVVARHVSACQVDGRRVLSGKKLKVRFKPSAQALVLVIALGEHPKARVATIANTYS